MHIGVFPIEIVENLLDQTFSTNRTQGVTSGFYERYLHGTVRNAT